MKRGWMAILVLAGCGKGDAGYKVGTERDYSPRCQFAGTYELTINLDDKPLRAQLDVGDPMVAFRPNPEKSAKWNDEKARLWLRTRMHGELVLPMPGRETGVETEANSLSPDHVRCRLTVHIRWGELVLDVNPATGDVLGNLTEDTGQTRALRGKRTAAAADPPAR